MSYKHLDKMKHLPNLFIRLRWAFLREYASDWHMPTNTEPYTVFWYLISGSKTVSLNGIDKKMNAGDLLIVPPHTPFSFKNNEEDRPLKYLSLILDAKMGPYHIANNYGLPNYSSINQESANDLLDLWNEIVHLNHKMGHISDPFSPHETVTQLKLQSLLSKWMTNILLVLAPYSDPPPKLDSRIQKIFLFVKEKPEEKINMETLVKLSHTSESHLRYLFQKHLNTSPMEYVRNLKIDKARELLLDTDFTIQEIAKLLGFSDSTTFSRMFRKYEGKSPKFYRLRDREL